jgi:hypothetical protein
MLIAMNLPTLRQKAHAGLVFYYAVRFAMSKAEAKNTAVEEAVETFPFNQSLAIVPVSRLS